MSDLLLIRDGSIDVAGTFGELHIADKVFGACEQPWMADADHPAGIPFHSCIPAGVYKLEPHDSPHHHNCWALVNHDLGVYHYEDPHAHRTACLIHPANWPIQLEGCIAPGSKVDYINGMLGVRDSRETLQLLHRMLPANEEHTLEIRWREYK